MTSSTLTPVQTSLVEAEEDNNRSLVTAALVVGGRARVTVTSRLTGKHLTVLFAAKKRGEDGKLISRARKDGRVGVGSADMLFCDGGDSAFGGWVGTLNLKTGEWKFPGELEDPRVPQYSWVARHVFAWALGSGDAEKFDAEAEVELASECSSCGRALTDPESIALGIGPECRGKATGSKHV